MALFASVSVRFVAAWATIIAIAGWMSITASAVAGAIDAHDASDATGDRAVVLDAQQPARQHRLNIVWLTVEDMSPWLACYGDDTVPTPNIDRLAREGVRYTNAFATSPVCAPARSSLLTGMYATRIGAMHMRTGNPSAAAIERDPSAYAGIPSYEAVPPAFVRCFPQLLREAGYYCTNNAKKDYQFREPVSVWDASSREAHWRGRADDQPFFAVFNHTGTHESQAFPEARRRPEVVSADDVPIPPFYPDTPNVRDALARTYNNIAAMDAWVGERIAELEEAGLLESTIIMFFSDHGVGLPRGKRSCYDTGTRVPLIVRFPDGALAGSMNDRVVSFVDFGPTVLSLAEVEPDERLDGLAFLGNHARLGTGYAFSHADRFDAVYDRVRSVTDGRFRYVRNLRTDLPYIIPNAYREQLLMTHDLYAMREPGASANAQQWQMVVSTRPAEELYDAQHDPWEVHNLADDPAHAERLQAMRAVLDAWIESTGDLGLVLPESRMVGEHLWRPDGEQPVTAAAELMDGLEGQEEGRYTFSLFCETVGATISYRVGADRETFGPWRSYRDGVMTIDADEALIQVETHRIGFTPTRTEWDRR